MLRGLTKTGYKYEIDENVLDDMRLIDALCDLEDNPLRAGKVVDILFGKAGKEELYKDLAEPDGRVPIEKVTDTLTEIFEDHAKNS